MGVSLPPVPDQEEYDHWLAQQAKPKPATTDTVPPVPDDDEAEFAAFKAKQPGPAPYMDPSRATEPSTKLKQSFDRALRPPAPDLKAPMIAAADAARVRADRPLPTEHLPGQSGNLMNDVAESAMEMVTHPAHVAKDIVMTPVRAGAAARRYAEGKGSGKEAAQLAAQTIALGATGPLEGALAKPAAAVLGAKLGPAAARAIVGAGAGATFTPDRPELGAILGGATGGAELTGKAASAAIDKTLGAVGDVSQGMVEAGAAGLRPSGPPVDQPRQLSRAQEVLRARLESEGITPAGPITRRPAPVGPPIVEPPPEAATYSTTGAKRRPAAAAPPQEAPATPPVERRADPEAPRPVWSAEERSQHITERQKKFATKVNKPWSQWTPEERAEYFSDQAQARLSAPWATKPAEAAKASLPTGNPDEIPTIEALKYATQRLGPEGFRQAVQESVSGTGTGTIGSASGRIERTAREIVRQGQKEAESVSWPPLPKEGDLTPVAAAGAEGVETRPGVMRGVNAEKPALPSPLRLPEPTAADRAVVQPKGYKEISPEEVAARKPPEPVIAERPTRQEMPEGAKVDEGGLFFEHRTPGGELRPFSRVSTDGLIKAYREQLDQLQRDEQASVYRQVEADVSGTQYGVQIETGKQSGRGQSYQAEAAQRVRNYHKVIERIDAELKKRGLESGDVMARMKDQEDFEATLEREAMDYNEREMAADEAFDMGDMSTERPKNVNKNVNPAEEPPSDVLNVAKLNLGSKTAEQRMAAKLEEFRQLRESQKQTFAEADVNRQEVLNELRAGDPLALPTERAKKLSGEELLARRDLVRENDGLIEALSKRLEQTVDSAERQQVSDLLQRAVDHNDALLSDLVVGSSQKGRDLNLLRRLATNSLDPAVWRVQAKRFLGDKPLTAEIDAMIRKLAKAAEDACRQ